MRREIEKADPRRLADLIDLDPKPESPTGPVALADLLRFQLAAPLATDLDHSAPGLCRRFAQAATASGVGPPLATFADLFRHPHPPLELLELVKRFAKHARQDVGGHLPTEIASVLYYASIALALHHHGKAISSISPKDLRAGIDWIRIQEWTPRELADLLGSVLT